MKRIQYLIALSVLSLSGCSDYNISEISEPAKAGIEEPEIDVSPMEHSFGAISAGSQTSDVIITISNSGNGDLNIHDVYLQNGTSNFSLSSLPASAVSPLDSTDLIISYSPGTYEFNSDVALIYSNDTDEPIVEVVLDGSGDAPVISVSPDYYDMGTVFLGCEDYLDISVGNIGNSDLIISDIEYFSSLPVDFLMYDYETDYGTLPLLISPGDEINLYVAYIPLDTMDDSAYIEIASNDPATPTAYADHDGLGDYKSWVVDNFTQDGDAAVDILFVIDNSGSMSSNQTNLKNNFGDFMSVFVSAGVDYHVALITTDDALFVGNVITTASTDPITEFSDQIDLIGYHGSPIEKGLWYAYESTTSGGDAEPGSSTGFFRTSARLVVVYVSDEPDVSTNTSSYGGGSATMTPSDYSSHLLSLKASPDLVVAHAVAGDYPSGCSTNGGAQFGDGYYDVVTDLGGTFMSICAADWSVTMDTLARESMAITSFALSGHPIEDTISVEVDGAASTDWIYYSSSNTIVFNTAPADESTIDITYAIWAECETEE